MVRVSIRIRVRIKIRVMVRVKVRAWLIPASRTYNTLWPEPRELPAIRPLNGYERSSERPCKRRAPAPI